MDSNKYQIPVRIILLILALLLLSGIIIGYTLYNKPHRSIEKEKAVAITAIQLFNEFEKNETEANAKYLNKTVLVTGVVSEVSSNQEGKTILILESSNPIFGISCTMEGKVTDIVPGTTITMKGVCTGYLSDVVVIRAIISQNVK